MGPMFSSRLPASLAPTPLAAVVAAARRDRGPRLLDLTVSNPTTTGIAYPQTLIDAWSNADALRYAPDARGLHSARDAVAGHYASIGDPVHPDALVLAASTSEAYAFLFKLLCDPGDDVLVPCPSYPLFEHLARLEGVQAVPYMSRDIGRWTLDERDLEARVTPRTRALVVVAPNNPTGHVPTPGEWEALAAVCRRHRLALIVDEVFAAYPLGDPGHPTPADLTTPSVPIPTLDDVLQFRLNGLSKLVGLPQAKLGWIRVSGPDEVVRHALEALDLIADTYLSVSTPVQTALPALLQAGRAVREAIRVRLASNLGRVRTTLAGTPLDPRLPDGGWTLVVRAPLVGEADELALALLDRDVVVHPGYFYDLPHDGYLVLSLLTPERDMQRGLETLCSLPMLQFT